MTSIRKLTDEEIRSRIGARRGWTFHNNQLTREFKFRDFTDAFGFLAKVATLAERLNHHPEVFNVYDTVRIALSTHEAAGVSERDFELAAAIDERLS